MTLRLRTFGAVCLERDGAPLAGPHAQRRRLALLAYLSATNTTPVTRDKLLALLWPERAEHSARHSLSQLLYALRQELPANALITSAEELRLDQSALPSDVSDFSEAVRTGQDERAVELYRGPFLDGFFVDDAEEFERWAEIERSRLRTAYVSALERLSEKALNSGDGFRAVDWCQRRVEADRTDGTAVLGLMRALVAIGDRTGALRQARGYSALVREEFGADPDSAVVALVEKLQEEAARPVAVSPKIEMSALTATPTPTPTPAPTPTTAPVHMRWQSWSVAAAIVVLAGMVALVASQPNDSAPSKASAKSVTVLVGDLSGPDPVLALAVREALRAELSAAETVTQITDLRAREIQTLMGRETLAPLQSQLLIEVAQRSGAQIAIAGSAAPLGEGAQLLVQLIDPATSEVLETVTGRAADAGGVVPAVAAVGRALRAAIAQVPLDTTVRPLPAVTTTSLPALKSYALARQVAARGQPRHGGTTR